MNLPAQLLDQAARFGLRLERRGNMLAVIPKGKCPPDFADVLREHKRELLDLLTSRSAGLRPDEVPWLHIASQVVAGEFDDDLDNSLRDSLTIGLRSIDHPNCRLAIERLHGLRNH